MSTRYCRFFLNIPILMGMVAWYFLPTLTAYAGDEESLDRYEQLAKQVEILNAELADLRSQINAEPTPEPSRADTTSSVTPTVPVYKSIGGDSLYHLSGYFDVGYTSVENGNDSFVLGHFSPIFHYQYKDWMLFESEIAISLEQAEDGSLETEIEIEYMSLDLFANDYVTLVMGKFLNTIGQFIQNYHPSWINRLPSMPVGFGGGHHESGVAPVSEVGFQLRGGFPIGKTRIGYAAYVGNGPQLNVEEDGDGDLSIVGVDTSGIVEDYNNNKSVGGRLGFLPFPNLEIGISAGRAKAGFNSIGAHGHDEVADDHADEGEDEHAEDTEQDHEEIIDPFINDREYVVYGADFFYRPHFFKNLTLRGEYVSTELGSGDHEEADHDKKEWKAWYVQGSYFLGESKFETVIRYGKYEDAFGVTQEQWTPGLNYVLASNVLIKLGYEFNRSGDIERDQDRFLLQFAYGF